MGQSQKPRMALWVTSRGGVHLREGQALQGGGKGLARSVREHGRGTSEELEVRASGGEGFE